MHVNVATQILPPGMEHGCHAQLTLQVFGCMAKLTERIPN
ncbi:hypothetical protein Q673_18825 [Marinobacter sp. EN3]|nr:hypothetical protein Q673_18825 [Marinobacter sp. EN3]